MSDCITKETCNCHKKEIMEHIKGKSKLSQRGVDWLEFSKVVLDHIEKYTVPQYGDKGEDLITGYSANDCIEHIKKYGKRYGQQSREGQQELDFLKIAHFAQCAWEKYKNLDTSPEKEELIILEKRCDDVMKNKEYFYIGCTNSTEETPIKYVYKRRNK